MEKQYRVLSIDGGGIRGIIPAMILAEIEERTGKRISELFDFIAGTSTGGILGLGLVIPGEDGKPKYAAEDLVKLYQDNGSTIFSKDTWKRIQSAGGVLDEKYSQAGIESVLEKYFGDAELKDVLTDVLITSYDLETRRPFFFKSMKAKKDPNRNHLVRLAARATSAAPTYFEPLKLTTDDRFTYYSLVDGGLYANNPAMCAYAEVTRMDKRDLLFVSLGTGEMSAQTISHDKARNWGVMEWIKPLIDVMMDGNSDTVAYQLAQVMDVKPNSDYYRIQANLTKDSAEMDNVKDSNIRKLKIIANDTIRDESKAIQAICDRLLKQFDDAETMG
ncbi:MAG: CBASS cGAMP-activated phospholipase [Flammeovirgaceae bacterium]